MECNIITIRLFFQIFKKVISTFCIFSFSKCFSKYIISIYLLYKPKITTYKTQLLFCFIIVAISLITLPITVYLLSNFEILNIIITSIMILLQGLLNAICQSSAFGLVSFFPFEMIVSLSFGQALAGILTNIIAFIIKICFGKISLEIEALVYFSISTLFIIICFIFIILVYKNDYFKSQLTLSGEFNNSNSLINNKFKNNDNIKNENNSQTDKEINNEDKKEISFMDLTKLLINVNILIAILYITTMTLYPNSFLLFESLKTLFQSYQTITILSIYNIFDTIGRYSENFLPKNLLSIYIILSLLIIVPFLHTFKNNDSIILNIIILICIAFLGITNGIGTSLILGFAPTLVPDELKGKAGSSVSFYLITGIFLGSCFNFLMNYIITNIKK